MHNRTLKCTFVYTLHAVADSYECLCILMSKVKRAPDHARVLLYNE